MKKIILGLMCLVSFGVASCDFPRGISETESCKARAQGAGQGVATGIYYNEGYKTRSNQEIYDLCYSHIGQWKGGQYENIFMYSCAKPLGYQFK